MLLLAITTLAKLPFQSIIGGLLDVLLFAFGPNPFTVNFPLNGFPYLSFSHLVFESNLPIWYADFEVPLNLARVFIVRLAKHPTLSLRFFYVIHRIFFLLQLYK
jgi:hypothetical protein